MIILSLILMFILFIVAGATQLWFIAVIGVGIFLATVFMYLMALNDVFNSVMIIVIAIAAPILFLVYKENLILIISYIAIGLWLNSSTIMDNDIYSEWTLEGKIYYFWDERATDFLINLYTVFFTIIWGGLALIGIKFHWFLIIPSIYLVARSVIVLIKSREYSLNHSFTLVSDAKNSFESFLDGIKRLFTGGSRYNREFSWWNFILGFIVIILALGLILLERTNQYSEFAKNINFTNLFDSSKWFYFTKLIWNYIPVACENLSAKLLFFGDLLNIPLAIILFIVTVIIAIIEVVLSIIWIIIALILDEIIPFIIGFILLFIVPVLLPVGVIILIIRSFTTDQSLFNKIWSILSLIISAICCIIYFLYMSKTMLIIPFSF